MAKQDIIFPSGGGTIGPIVNIPFNTGDWFADAGLIWDVAEGEVQSFWYSLLSHELALINFSVDGSVIDGTQAGGLELRVQLPNGWTIKSHSAFGYLAINQAKFKPGIATLDTDETYLGLGMAVNDDAWEPGISAGLHNNNAEGQVIVNFK